MNIIEFPEQTVVYAKDQPEYRPLPAYQYNDKYGRITCLWSLSFIERLQVLFTGRIWHTIMTYGRPLQPQLLTTTKPSMKAQ